MTHIFDKKFVMKKLDYVNHIQEVLDPGGEKIMLYI